MPPLSFLGSRGATLHLTSAQKEAFGGLSDLRIEVLLHTLARESLWGVERGSFSLRAFVPFGGFIVVAARAIVRIRPIARLWRRLLECDYAPRVEDLRSSHSAVDHPQKGMAPAQAHQIFVVDRIKSRVHPSPLLWRVSRDETCRIFDAQSTYRFAQTKIRYLTRMRKTLGEVRTNQVMAIRIIYIHIRFLLPVWSL